MKHYLLPSLICLICFSSSIQADQCTIKYKMKGWSVFYKTYQGTAAVFCRNGQNAKVKLSLKAGGVTLGSSDITAGQGVINGVSNIRDIYGTYFSMGGHAGFLQSFEARLLFKGATSLGLSGKGGGFDFGFSFGALTISP